MYRRKISPNVPLLLRFYQDFITHSYTPSSVSYYFGRIPFPLKQKHPLNYNIKILCFLPDCTKRLFSGRGKQKRAVIQPFSLFRLFFTVFIICKHGNSVYEHGNPHIITKTPNEFPW